MLQDHSHREAFYAFSFPTKGLLENALSVHPCSALFCMMAPEGCSTEHLDQSIPTLSAGLVHPAISKHIHISPSSIYHAPLTTLHTFLDVAWLSLEQKIKTLLTKGWDGVFCLLKAVCDSYTTDHVSHTWLRSCWSRSHTISLLCSPWPPVASTSHVLHPSKLPLGISLLMSAGEKPRGPSTLQFGEGIACVSTPAYSRMQLVLLSPYYSPPLNT